jgi:amino acid transporter
MYFLLTTSSRSFIGYTSINSVLSEVRDPVRTIRLAAPLAMISVAAVYFFINISYYAVVSKTDILESQRIVALVTSFYCLIIPFIQLFYRALYFRNLFGPTTERVGFRYILHLRLLMPYMP